MGKVDGAVVEVGPLEGEEVAGEAEMSLMSISTWADAGLVQGWCGQGEQPEGRGHDSTMRSLSGGWTAAEHSGIMTQRTSACGKKRRRSDAMKASEDRNRRRTQRRVISIGRFA